MWWHIRIAYLAGMVLIGGMVGIPRVGMALPDQAGHFIVEVGDKALAIVKSATSPAQKEDELSALFNSVVDVDWMARFVIGRYWNTATPEEQKKYASLYQKFLTQSYVPKFRDYTDQKLVIKKSYEEDTDEYIVETVVVSSSNQPVAVSYRVRKAGKMYRIFDVIAEGVSLITTQRSEFGSILSREGLAVLITKLEQKTANPSPDNSSMIASPK